MLEFKELEITDKNLVNRYLEKCGRRNCESNFSTLFNWGGALGTKLAVTEGTLLLSFERKGEILFYPPLGEHVNEAVQQAIDYAKAQGKGLQFVTLSETMAEELREEFPEFSLEYSEDDSDYVYLAEKLQTLSGKKLHGKRNHISRFEKTYSYEFSLIGPADYDDCLEINYEWCRQNGSCTSESAQNELCAIRRCFANFEQLDVTGGILRVDGKSIAFTVGSRLYPGSDTYNIHFEKALDGYEGAYPAINKYFANTLPENIVFINREEDMGVPGLRKAKQSYRPEFLEPKYRLRYRG